MNWPKLSGTELTGGVLLRAAYEILWEAARAVAASWTQPVLIYSRETLGALLLKLVYRATSGDASIDATAAR